jgi:hypothetical protein
MTSLSFSVFNATKWLLLKRIVIFKTHYPNLGSVSVLQVTSNTGLSTQLTFLPVLMEGILLCFINY